MPNTDTESRNSSRNAWALPFEILGEVFQYVVYEAGDGPLALRHIMLVCRLWYTAVMNDPRLWTRVFLDGPFFLYFRDTPISSTCAFLQRWLDRSGTLPLHIRLGCDDLHKFCPSSPSPLDCSVEHPTERFARLLEVMKRSDYKHIKRSQSFVWRHTYKYPVQADILNIFPPQLPLLRFMSISTLIYDLPSSISHCPLLAEVEILDHSERLPFFQSQDLARVKTLSFHNHSSLRTAWNFGSPESVYALASIFSDKPIELSHLRMLTVRGVVPKEVLLQLVVPALRELLIEDDDQGYTAVPRLHTLIPPSCHQIRARFSPKVKEANPRWVGDVTGLVKMVPRLDVLCVSKWMQQEMEEVAHNSNFELRVERER